MVPDNGVRDAKAFGVDMTDTKPHDTTAQPPEVLEHLVIRFAGDSGDGMQLTGDRFTNVSAQFGNDLLGLA